MQFKKIKKVKYITYIRIMSDFFDFCNHLYMREIFYILRIMGRSYGLNRKNNLFNGLKT